jgi:poly(3-hydroxybutyrate) depolymerase
MGGMMSYALECSIPEKFTAFGPNSGYLLGGTGGCSNAPPKPIFHIHGAADDFVKYSNLQSFLNFFITKWHCPSKQTTANYNGNSKLTKDYWGPCDQGGEVTLISVAGMKHEIKNGTDFSEAQEVWNYFKKFTDGTGISAPAPVRQVSRSVSAVYRLGNIHLNGDGTVGLVRVFDVKGRMVALWQNAAVQSCNVSVPVNHLTGGIYLLTITGSIGGAHASVVIP